MKIIDVYGKKSRLEWITNTLNCPLKGMEAPLLTEKQKDFKNQQIVEYHTLYRFACGFLSKSVADLLDERLSIQNLYAIPIPFGREILGEFCLALTPGRQISCPQLAVVFSRFVGILLRQKELEEQLEKGTAEYHTLLESFPQALCLFSRRGDLLAVNQVFCQKTGYQKDHLLKMNVTHLFTENGQQDIFQQMMAEESFLESVPLKSRARAPIYFSFKGLPSGVGWGMDLNLGPQLFCTSLFS